MRNGESLRFTVIVYQSQRHLHQSFNSIKKRESDRNPNVYVAKILVESDLQSTISIPDTN